MIVFAKSLLFLESDRRTREKVLWGNDYILKLDN